MIVGRYGLPTATDLVYLDVLPVGTTCFFLGDADPPDVMAFAWLREQARIVWLGVSDQLLNRNPLSYLPSLEIGMSEAEKLAMGRISDFCPDFRDLLGPYCSATLGRGFKIELEAAMISLSSRPGGGCRPELGRAPEPPIGRVQNGRSFGGGRVTPVVGHCAGPIT